jgi:hypothetical protein
VRHCDEQNIDCCHNTRYIEQDSKGQERRGNEQEITTQHHKQQGN